MSLSSMKMIRFSEPYIVMELHLMEYLLGTDIFEMGGIHCVTLDLDREGEIQDFFPER
jgi:hypothetical protein